MHTKVKNLCYIALFAALIAVCTWITVPGAVPFTMQTFAVFCALATLGGKGGTISILIYIVLGAVGVPVFAGFTGGIGILFGTTGGYIIGFLFAALVTGLLLRAFGDGVISLFLSMCAGVAVCYLFGTVWFYVLAVSGGGDAAFLTIMAKCVFPFIPFDLIKMALATLLVRRLKKVLVL